MSTASTLHRLHESPPDAGDVFRPELPLTLRIDEPEREGGLRIQNRYKRSESNHPLISVITVVLNGAERLERAMTSVFEQDYDNVEYIVVDGSSSDGTIGLLEQNNARLDYWLSQPDRGIYDAMNKGLRLASGSLIGILNSDDWYEPGALRAVADAHRAEPDAYLHGYLRSIRAGKMVQTLLRSPEFLHEGSLLHPTNFIPRSAYQKIGAYDTAFPIAADYDFQLRALQAGIPFRAIEAVLANFSEDSGVSTRRPEETHLDVVRVQVARGLQPPEYERRERRRLRLRKALRRILRLTG